MNIHEYQAKEILKQYGIPVSSGSAVHSPEEAFEVAKNIAQPGKLFAVKAQVHAGARGKAGGIKIVKTPEEVKEAAKSILGRRLVTLQTGPEGKPVDQVLIETTIPIVSEYYASIVLDRSAEKPCLIVSAAGGMDIEEVAHKSPDKIFKKHFPASSPLLPKEALEAANFMTKDQKHAAIFADVFSKLSKVFLDLDISLIEINPLAVMQNGDIVAVDAKINFDDNALYRHSEIAALQDARQEDPREVEAKKAGLSYVGLEGNIGCVVNGAGLAMATMDIIKYAGGEPANFLDVGGGASKEKVAAAFKIILMDAHVKAILVNIFGGIMRCDVVAQGILAAVEELSKTSSIRDLPLVVRLEGTNVKEGKEILKSSSLKIIAAENFGEAAEKVVAALRK